MVAFRGVVRIANLEGDEPNSGSIVRSFTMVIVNSPPPVLIGAEKICSIFAGSTAGCATSMVGAAHAIAATRIRAFFIAVAYQIAFNARGWRGPAARSAADRVTPA